MLNSLTYFKKKFACTACLSHTEYVFTFPHHICTDICYIRRLTLPRKRCCKCTWRKLWNRINWQITRLKKHAHIRNSSVPFCWLNWCLLSLSITLTYQLYCCFSTFGLIYKRIISEHWPETREFITRTVELWNRWIRLSCYYNRV